MYEKVISYTDYNGVDRKETFNFNLSKSELARMQFSVDGGMAKKLEDIISRFNIPELMSNFEMIIKASYGEVSPDGRRFMKSAEKAEEFLQTPAYDVLYMELLTDSKAAAEFFNSVMNADVSQAQINAKMNELGVKTE